MKKVTAIILAVVLACAWMPGLASAIGTGATYTGTTATSAGSTLLSSLSHNCPNTGIMLPESFSPYQTTYLLPLATYWPLTVIRALGSAATGVNVGLLTQLATVSRYVV